MTALEDDVENGREFDIPAVRTYGAAYRIAVHTDSRGAVMVAYTRDGESGAVTRSEIRLDPGTVAYVLRRLGAREETPA
ncbi:hypothetical protein ACIBEA_41755 [Streptomyces sp. NPDC051555]|uniref:hypothetical protein n=1 Tax=Streptomyces sp. NPDC051555 TaxID=3365657 RepID=UPI0037B384AA